MERDTLNALLRLNQLSLTEEETEQFLAGYALRRGMELELETCDTAAVEPMVHVAPMVNVLREDRSEKQFSRERLQEGAPEVSDGYWQVPRLLD